MKVLICLLILLASFSCNRTPDYEILYCDLYSTYPINLECDNFYDKSDKEVDILQLNNYQALYLKNKILNLKVSENKNLDVRMKGYIMNNNDTLNVCANSGIIRVNNEYYIVDDSLRIFLEHVTHNPLAKQIEEIKRKRAGGSK